MGEWWKEHDEYRKKFSAGDDARITGSFILLPVLGIAALGALLWGAIELLL